MHDPLTVAFHIIRPWPQRSGVSAAPGEVRWRAGRRRFWRLAGRDYFWPSLVTIWHKEPGGHDALTTCGRKYYRDDTYRPARSWRWHVHHWRLQVPALQMLRRRLLTRCQDCGGKSTRQCPVDVSASWETPHSPWWRGEKGLSHMDCATGRMPAHEL